MIRKLFEKATTDATDVSSGDFDFEELSSTGGQSGLRTLSTQHIPSNTALRTRGNVAPSHSEHVGGDAVRHSQVLRAGVEKDVTNGSIDYVVAAQSLFIPSMTSRLRRFELIQA